jgi:hypothetical protein
MDIFTLMYYIDFSSQSKIEKEEDHKTGRLWILKGMYVYIGCCSASRTGSYSARALSEVSYNQVS